MRARARAHTVLCAHEIVFVYYLFSSFDVVVFIVVIIAVVVFEEKLCTNHRKNIMSTAPIGSDCLGKWNGIEL